MKGDFHMHTTYSDGALSVSEVLDIGKKLDYISITDHDYLQGAFDALAMARSKPKIIIGFELSTEHLGESIHILGYFSSMNRLDELNQYLQKQRDNRLRRAYIIKEKLLQYFNIDLNMDFTKSIDSVTRGTIAEQIIKQGFPYKKEDIFKHMIGRGCPAYLPSTKLATKEGIALIHQYLGLAVLAHPTNLKDVKIDDIIAMGIDGIEAIYSQNKPFEEEMFREIAKDNHLFITAGSDFHRFDDYKHGDIGSVVLENDELAVFLKELGIII
ncbi:MAG: PHP domain-containing protein [Bacilli bacterium]